MLLFQQSACVFRKQNSWSHRWLELTALINCHFWKTKLFYQVRITKFNHREIEITVKQIKMNQGSKKIAVNCEEVCSLVLQVLHHWSEWITLATMKGQTKRWLEVNIRDDCHRKRCVCEILWSVLIVIAAFKQSEKVFARLLLYGKLIKTFCHK